MSAIATVARQFGASVLIAEQNVPATLVVADRIVILKHGKLVARYALLTARPRRSYGTTSDRTRNITGGKCR
jgi:ABC-type branched-subunit amino acid transport system ATPase component